MRKNVAGQNVGAQLVDTAGAPVTGGTTTVYLSGDGAAQAPIGTATSAGNGAWTIAPSQANTNYDHMLLTWVNTGAVNVTQNIYTTSLDPDVLYAQAAQLPATLDSGRVKANAEAIADDAVAATNLAAGANEVIPFVVGASASSTSIPTDITGAPYTTADHFKDRVVTIQGETKKIVGSSGSPVVLTTTDFVSVPAQSTPGAIS